MWVDNAVMSAHASVEMRVPAEADQLAVTRAVARAIVAQRDWGLDAIDDLRLAVDEACTRLIRCALADTMLVCRFALSGRRIEFRVSSLVDPTTASLCSERDLRWHVLRSLTEDLTMRQEPVTGPGHETVLIVEFALRAGELGPGEYG
jgi:serine/threonine-protein kinase RsbW